MHSLVVLGQRQIDAVRFPEHLLGSLERRRGKLEVGRHMGSREPPPPGHPPSSVLLLLEVPQVSPLGQDGVGVPLAGAVAQGVGVVSSGSTLNKTKN